MVEASRTDVGDMLFKAEVGRDDNSKHSDMLLWCDNIHCKLQRWKVKSCCKRLLPAQSSSVLCSASFDCLISTG